MTDDGWMCSGFGPMTSSRPWFYRSPAQLRADLHNKYAQIYDNRSDDYFCALLYHDIKSEYNRRKMGLETERLAMLQSYVAYMRFIGDSNQLEVLGDDYVEKRESYLEAHSTFNYIYG